jgi:hypothetical protein
VADLTELRELWAHGDGVNRGALISSPPELGETGLCLSVTTDDDEAVLWLTDSAAHQLLAALEHKLRQCEATVGAPGTAAEAMRCERKPGHRGRHLSWPVEW